MLELQDRPPGILVIEAGGPSPGKGPGLGLTGGTASPCAQLILEWGSAPIADGVIEEDDPAPDIRGQSGGQNAKSAIQGLRRKHQI
jgi:hypothetical protein